MPELESIFHDLVRFQIELWNQVDARLHDDLGSSLGHFEGMRSIASREGTRVYDVADDLVITIGGASKLVDRIESAGLCERRANPDDRRSSLLQLTASGASLLAKATAAVGDELRLRLGERLTPTELDTFAATLSGLRDQKPAAHQHASQKAEATR
jgi:DNA-binding MarR family transcriptional regulator